MTRTKRARKSAKSKVEESRQKRRPGSRRRKKTNNTPPSPSPTRVGCNEGGVQIKGFTYGKSGKIGKKLCTTVDGREIHFGSSAHGHFHDLTGIWKSLDHHDKRRRDDYLRRSGGITNKRGQITKDDKRYANSHSRDILWPLRVPRR